jgi:hypothetical protein
MFKGLLNRVRVDLVRICLNFDAQLTGSIGQWGE